MSSFLSFFDVAHTFESLEQQPSRLAKTRALASLLEKVRPEEAQIIAYFSLGDIKPRYQGVQFNFAEKSMIKVIAKRAGQAPEAVKELVAMHGDLGAVISQLSWHNPESNLSIQALYEQLLELATLTGIGSQEQKDRFIYLLLDKLDAVSAKYVIRIILGKLRLGFSDMTLLDAFSWMATEGKSLKPCLENGYNVSADIGLIIYTLKKYGVQGVKNISISPGVPIRLAAAERLNDAQEIVAKLGNCCAQPKLDGFRLQVHLDKSCDEPRVCFFSRNLQNMSAMFPDLHQALIKLNVKNLIAEGEAIAYDAQTGNFLPFQETVKRKRKHGIADVAQEYPLKLFFFDILYLNNESLLSYPHVQRRKMLVDLFNKSSDLAVIQPIEECKISHADELEEYFESMIAQGLEGVVVKRFDSPYTAGKRNFNWIKLKRQETGSLDDTLDCVILGYYAGRGKRAQFGIGAFLVGVFNSEKEGFETVAKIGTGLSDNEWRKLKSECDERVIMNKPEEVSCAKDLIPEVWVRPELVCLVRADEITRSPIHTAGKTKTEHGFALRFPRIMGYREDKSSTDATTVNEVKNLFNLQFCRKSK